MILRETRVYKGIILKYNPSLVWTTVMLGMEPDGAKAQLLLQGYAVSGTGPQVLASPQCGLSTCCVQNPPQASASPTS